jgi:hypothetical protein
MGVYYRVIFDSFRYQLLARGPSPLLHLYKSVPITYIFFVSDTVVDKADILRIVLFFISVKPRRTIPTESANLSEIQSQ